MESLEEQRKAVEAELERLRSEAEPPNNKNLPGAADSKSALVKAEEQPLKSEPSTNKTLSSNDPQPNCSESLAPQTLCSSEQSAALKVDLKSEPDSLCTVVKPSATCDNSTPTVLPNTANESTREKAQESETLEKEQLLSLAAELGCRNPPRQCKTRASATAHATPSPPTRTSSRRSRASDRTSTPTPQAVVEDSSTDRSPVSPRTSSLSCAKGNKRSKSSSHKPRSSSSSSSKKDKRRSRSSHAKKGNKTKREKKVCS